MNVFKEDMVEAKERMNAWWDHEIIDRPCINYWCPLPNVKISAEDINEFFDCWHLARNHDEINPSLDWFESVAKKSIFGGEHIPQFFPNYGPGIMAAVLGIEPSEFSENARTVWFSRQTSIKEILSLLESVELNKNNIWYNRLMQITEIAAKRARKNYSIKVTDLGGVLDIMSSFLRPEKIILGMKRNPEIIDACRTIILEKLLKVYDDLQSIIEKYGNGCSSWMNLWSSKRWYPIQCDFSAMLNPKWFKKFALPDIIAQAEHMDYAIYHLDGPDALKYLDELLAVKSITGIQWVPGAGRELTCDDHWLPVYKKIQAAGKNIVMDGFERPELLSHFYNILDPKQLYIQVFSSNYLRMKFCLPKFVGGQGGEGNYRQFRLEEKKAMKNRKKS
ncbi:MAG: hypothetical protein GY870_20950 [archaeon]|nr:hypothetical protein [archaeon]